MSNRWSVIPGALANEESSPDSELGTWNWWDCHRPEWITS